MNALIQCPKCGAGIQSRVGGNTMDCGTWLSSNGTFKTESAACIERQRDQLAARVKRLEEARGILHDHCIELADKCPNCQGSGQNHDGEGPLNESCPDCERTRIALSLSDDKAKEAAHD